MSKAKLTLIGLYNWDNDLFKFFSIPSGLDADTAIGCILQRSAEFELIYPDFDFIQYMIGLISKKWARTFQKWYNALQLEYNPIENYDRHEEWSDSNSEEGSNKGTIGTASNSSENSEATSQTDTFVTAYDSDTLHQDGQSKSNQNAKSSGNDNSTETRDLSDSRSSNAKHTGHTHGNIGVTTSQQMLEAELDIDYWNLYEHISDIFVRELCIPVY